MPEYDNTNRGAFWKNARKETETHPDYSGSIDVEGVQYWLSAWKGKKNEAGTGPLVNIRINRKEPIPEQQAPAANPAPEGQDDEGFDDDIPF